MLRVTCWNWRILYYRGAVYKTLLFKGFFKTSIFWHTIKCEVKNIDPIQKVLYQILLFIRPHFKFPMEFSIPEVVGYKASLFHIFTPNWLLMRPYGDCVSGLITSPCAIKSTSEYQQLIYFRTEIWILLKKNIF